MTNDLFERMCFYVRWLTAFIAGACIAVAAVRYDAGASLLVVVSALAGLAGGVSCVLHAASRVYGDPVWLRSLTAPVKPKEGGN